VTLEEFSWGMVKPKPMVELNEGEQDQVSSAFHEYDDTKGVPEQAKRLRVKMKKVNIAHCDCSRVGGGEGLCVRPLSTRQS
jgi:hypothetical protein